MSPKKKSDAVTTAAPSESKPWYITTWAGMDNYECSDCPFATLDPDAIAEHVRLHEPEPVIDHADPEPDLPGNEENESAAVILITDAMMTESAIESIADETIEEGSEPA